MPETTQSTVDEQTLRRNKMQLAVYGIGWVLAMLVLTFVVSGGVVGVRPLIGGWIPSWVALTYVLCIGIVISYFWVYDKVIEIVVTTPDGE